MASLLAGGHKQVSLLVNETDLTAYTIHSHGKLAAIAVINLRMFQTADKERGFVDVIVEARNLADKDERFMWVERLTADGADARNGVDFAGWHVGDDGRLAGHWDRERVSQGKVRVWDSEAVIVRL